MTNISKLIVFTMIAILTFQHNTEASARPGPKSIKRIQQVKKMKLLDVLDLDDKQVDKFLVKYNTWEDKMMGNKELSDIARKELDLAVQKKEDKGELTKKTNKFVESVEAMHRIMREKNADMKNVLNEEQYAKFLLFEDRFMHDLQKTMFRMMKKGNIPPPEFDDDERPSPRGANKK